MCSRFCTNTVDSLPQYTVTNVTTNDVLIFSLRTETATNVLTETTVVPEFGDSANERFTTTEIDATINSPVPTKMFKGDDFVENFTAFDRNAIPTTNSNPTGSVTITEPSIEEYNGYTVENENQIGSTRSSIDIDEKSSTASLAGSSAFEDSTETNEKSEKPTNEVDRTTSEDDFQTNTVPSLTSNNQNVLENSTQFSEPETIIKATTPYDESSKTINYFNDSTETTQTPTTISSQISITENTVHVQNILNSTQQQATSSPIENETKYFNTNLLPVTLMPDDGTDLSHVTESFTESKPVQNAQTDKFPKDLIETTTGLETTIGNLKFSNTVQSTNVDQEITTNGFIESMNSRTVYFDEENELKLNELVTTQSYTEINTNNSQSISTENSNFKTIDTTTTRSELNDNVKIENNATILENTTSYEIQFQTSTSTTENQGDKPSSMNSVYSAPDGATKKEGTTTNTNFFTTTSDYSNVNTDRDDKNDQALATKSPIQNVDIFTSKKTEDFQFTTTAPMFSVATEQDTSTVPTSNKEDVEPTTIGTIVSDKSVENRLSTATISSNDEVDGKTTANSVTSYNGLAEENTERPIITTDAVNVEAIGVTAPGGLANNDNYNANNPFNSIFKTDSTQATTAVPKSTTIKSAESSIRPGGTGISDSNVSGETRQKWQTLFGLGGGNAADKVNASHELLPGKTASGPADAIAVTTEIFTENYGVTADFDGVDYGDSTTTSTTTTIIMRERGKNESIVTSTRAAVSDDTISAYETSTMANDEVTGGSDFETKNGSIVSQGTQNGDGSDKTDEDGRATAERFTTYRTVDGVITMANTENTESETATDTATAVDSASRDVAEMTTVAILTTADWIRTKSTAVKESPDRTVTERYAENRFDSSTGDPTTAVPFAQTDDDDRTDSPSTVSLNDATAMINILTTSIEVLVSSLNTEHYLTTTENPITTDSNEMNTDSPFNSNEFASTTTGVQTSTIQFDDVTETFTNEPTERTTATDSPKKNDFSDDKVEPDSTDPYDNNNMMTTTEYTVTSKSVEIEDVTLKRTNHDQTNINNGYTTQKTTTATRKWCWNDTDCDAGHKCLAAKCLPTGERRVYNCPPGIITLQCLEGIIYT